VRVVADSHILIFYLFVPDRLSEPALEALGEAEDTDGIVVSAATLDELWYASRKRGPKSLAPGAFESLRRSVLDPAHNFDIAPILAETMQRFDRVPLTALADPFDRFILVRLHRRTPAGPSPQMARRYRVQAPARQLKLSPQGATGGWEK
jgi:PIN domain nuclease of toxin-antitoxin system